MYSVGRIETKAVCISKAEVVDRYLLARLPVLLRCFGFWVLGFTRRVTLRDDVNLYRVSKLDPNSVHPDEEGDNNPYEYERLHHIYADDAARVWLQ
eukprot:scaffold200309_cov40-Prasinocladus_malaysianus.AAC.1